MTDARDVAADAGIRETIGRYAHYVDGERFAELAELFTPNGRLLIEAPGRDPVSLHGRDAVAAYLTQSAARRAADPALGRYRRHHVSSIIVDVETPLTASGSSYFLAVMSSGIHHFGQYWDRYVYDGRWLFASRRVRVDGRPDAPRAQPDRPST